MDEFQDGNPILMFGKFVTMNCLLSVIGILAFWCFFLWIGLIVASILGLLFGPRWWVEDTDDNPDRGRCPQKRIA